MAQGLHDQAGADAFPPRGAYEIRSPSDASSSPGFIWSRCIVRLSLVTARRAFARHLHKGIIRDPPPPLLSRLCFPQRESLESLLFIYFFPHSVREALIATPGGEAVLRVRACARVHARAHALYSFTEAERTVDRA